MYIEMYRSARTLPNQTGTSGPYSPVLEVYARDCKRAKRRALSPLDGVAGRGHTPGMKAAVSIPDEVFEQADRLARQLKTSRSHLYSRALKEFLSRHAPDQVTDAMNRVCEEVGAEPTEVRRRATRKILEKTEW